MSVANRRAAYRFARDAIDRALEDVPWINEREWGAIRGEVERIRDAFSSAASVVDEAGVDGHVSGTGKQGKKK